MATALDLQQKYSGGASNSLESASLGGIKSSVSVADQGATGFTNVTGVALAGCNGNNDGNGTLTFDFATTTLKWQGPGDSAGQTVDVSVDGTYVLYSGTKGYLALTVTAASLPGGNQSDTIAVTTTANTMWDNISKTESFNGDTEYRCYYLENTHGSDPFFGVGVFVDLQPTGDDTLELGLAPEGINGTAEDITVGGEGTAPAGVTFGTYTAGSPLNIGQLNAGDFIAIWVKRIVPALSATSTSNDRFRFGFAAFA